jgi:hypothetical protein
MRSDAEEQMAAAARDVLWHWIDEADDPDSEQRGWKRSRLEGILLACERTGVLTADELARWSRLASGGEPAVPAGADRQAADRCLARLLQKVRPMTRDGDPDRIREAGRFRGALRALANAGVITEGDRSSWHERELKASAPWLSTENVEQLASGGGVYAIAIPPRTPEEEAADEAAGRERERLGRRGVLERVATSRAPERHEGLAVVAVIVRSECTEILFHFVGPPHGEVGEGFGKPDAHRRLLDALVPPELTDDVGTTYEPATQRPMSSHGTGGTPDPERPRVVTGVWRYFPAAPKRATRFVVSLGSTRWAIH